MISQAFGLCLCKDFLRAVDHHVAESLAIQQSAPVHLGTEGFTSQTHVDGAHVLGERNAGPLAGTIINGVLQKPFHRSSVHSF